MKYEKFVQHKMLWIEDTLVLSRRRDLGDSVLPG